VAPVAPGAGIPAGQVAFVNNGTLIATVPVIGGVATFTTPSLLAGSHTIGAFYAGDGSYGISNASVGLSVAKATTTTTLVASANPSVAGQLVTLTATVAGAPGVNSPAGTVTFYDGSVSLGSKNLLNGGASLGVRFASAGSHSLRAVYSGAASYIGSAASLSQTVNPASTVTTVSSSNGSIVYGQAVTLNAKVVVAVPASGTPTGSVTFFDGTTALGSVPLTSGAASLGIPALGGGKRSITAVYSGDANDSASTSTVLAETVKQAVATTTFTSSSAGSTFGQTVTFTFNAAGSTSGLATPTGNVTFKDGTTVLGTIALSNGTASFAVSTLGVGTHSISAGYAGDVNYLSAGRSLQQSVAKGSTTTALVASPNPAAVGQAVTITATVTGAPGAAVPGGSVTFYNGSTVLGRVALTNGVAAIQFAFKSASDKALSATYSGSANYSPSTGSATETVQ